MTTPTEVQEFLANLYGGVFDQKIAHTLSDVAAGVIHHGREGKISINLTLKRIENSAQVTVDHELVYKKPTANGTQGENDKTSTPMFVNQGGQITLYPIDQLSMMPSATAPDYIKKSQGE